MLVLREPMFIYRSKGSKVSLLYQSKTSLLLTYIEILRHFSYKSSFCTSNSWQVFCFALSSGLSHSSLFTGAYAMPMSHVIRRNGFPLWTCVRQLAEDRDYCLVKLNPPPPPPPPEQCESLFYYGWMRFTTSFGLLKNNSHSLPF